MNTKTQETSAQAPHDAPDECWSGDGEDFNYQTLGDLLDTHGDTLEPGSVVYVGEAHHPSARVLCDADSVIEGIGERAYDIGGEYAEDFPGVSQEARDELQALLEAWLDKHASVTFYEVKNVREYVITANDLTTQPAQEQAHV